MAQQKGTSKSAFAAKMDKAAGAAFQVAKDKAPVVRGQGLPGGLQMAVAEVLDYTLDDTTKKERINFNCVLHTPPEMANRRFQHTCWLNESEYQTKDQAMEEFCSTVKLFGIDISDCENFGGLLSAIDEALASEDRVLFVLNTVKGKSRVRINVQERDELSGWQPDGAEPNRQDTPPFEENVEPASDPAEDPAEPADEPTAESDPPEVKDVWGYKPGPKSPVEDVVILKVYPKSKKVDAEQIKDNKKTGKVYKSISWSQLEPV